MGLKKLTKWVTRRTESVPGTSNDTSLDRATPAVAPCPTPPPSFTITPASHVTTAHDSIDNSVQSGNLGVPSPNSPERPSIDSRRYSSLPVPSLTPVSDINSEPIFVDAHRHLRATTPKTLSPMEKVQNQAPSKTKLSADNVKNFHDVVRRLKEAVSVEGTNPAKVGNGTQMYEKAMRLQEQVMKTNRVRARNNVCRHVEANEE